MERAPLEAVAMTANGDHKRMSHHLREETGARADRVNALIFMMLGSLTVVGFCALLWLMTAAR
jgi:hypothetical protein